MGFAGRLGPLILASLATSWSLPAQSLPQPRRVAHDSVAYRNRILGLFDDDSGDPIEGAEVRDLKSGTHTLTTATGTVSLAFLPIGGSLVRIRKVGYQPLTLVIPISPADTAPLTLILLRETTTLPTVVTTDSVSRHVPPSIQGFEERRKLGFGRFIDEAQLRARDDDAMSAILRQLPGATIQGGGLVTSRLSAPGPALLSGALKSCYVTVYENGVLLFQNGMQQGPPNFDRLSVNQYAAVEFYASAANYPPWVSRSNNNCGVLLLWTRYR